MVKVQKIAPYNFEFREISVQNSQTDCYFSFSISDLFYFYKILPYLLIMTG